MEDKIISTWDELKAIMSEVELDVLKNARGTAAAGVRARKGLRSLKSKISSLVKITVELDKCRKALRAEEKANKKSKANKK